MLFQAALVNYFTTSANLPYLSAAIERKSGNQHFSGDDLIKKKTTAKENLAAMLSIDAAAAALGCTVGFIADLIQNGKLVAHSVSIHGRTHQVVVRSSLNALPAAERSRFNRRRR